MNTTTNSPLANLTAAEAGLAVAIRAAASAVDEIATDGIDHAIARLEESVRSCHGRLGAAMGQLRQKIGEVVETMEALASGIFEDLSSDAPARRAGIDPDTLEPIDRQAKERQKARKGNQSGATVENLPQLDSGKARVQAGKAVGVSAKSLPENLPAVSSGDARDQAGKAVGVSGKTVDHATKVLEPTSNTEPTSAALIAEAPADDAGIYLDADPHVTAPPQQNAQEVRQDAQPSEPAESTAVSAIDTPTPPYAAATAVSAPVFAACSPPGEPDRDDHGPAPSTKKQRRRRGT